MRSVDYAAIALKDLRRQLVRSSLTVIALVISTVILVILAAISIGGRQAIVSQFGADESLKTITVTPNQGSAALSPFGGVQQVNDSAAKLDDGAVARLAKMPHVASAAPRALVWELKDFTVSGNNKTFVAQAAGVPSGAAPPLVAGSGFSSGDTQNEVILGYAYAKELGITTTPQELVSKTVKITTQKGYRGIGAHIPDVTATKQENDTFGQTATVLQAKIVGITAEGPDQNGLFLPLGWARQIRTARFAVPEGIKQVDQLAGDGYSSVVVTADAKENVKEVATAIGAMGYGQISTLSQIERLQQFSTTMWIILGAVAAIAVVAAALGVVNTMLMTVSEQRYAIGVWRACGAQKGFIVKLFLVEAAFLGLIGGTLGVVLGFGVSRLVNQYVNSLLKAQNLALTDIAVVPLWLMAGTVAVTTLFGVLAGLYPAWRAAREDPSRALTGGQ